MSFAHAADVPVITENELYRALIGDAEATVHFRTYLLDRSDTTGNDPGAWAGGGWLGYESDWIGGLLKLGAVGYTSQPIWAPDERDGTLLLKPVQEGYGVLGQAYAALNIEDQVLTFYRQLVNQPEVNPQDNRMTPNTFEGGSIKGDLGPFGYYAGYLTGMKKRNSTEFLNFAKSAGITDENSPMWLGGIDIEPIEALALRTSFYTVPDIMTSSYSDAVWTTPLREDLDLRLAGQFMLQGGNGEDLLTGCGCQTWAIGTKADLIYGGFILTGGYTQIGTAYDYQAPYGSWPGYTSMIVKDFNRAGEKAALFGLSYDFAEIGAPGLVFTGLAAVDIETTQDDPYWEEYDFTLDYRLKALDGDWAWLAPFWIRGRYARINMDDDGEMDAINDFRLIVNYEWVFGKEPG